jgi:hypothetical protein
MTCLIGKYKQKMKKIVGKKLQMKLQLMKITGHKGHMGHAVAV